MSNEPKKAFRFEGRIFRLMRKELGSVLRDRRTIITLVLMPVLLYPLLIIGFQQFFLAGGGGEKKKPTYIVTAATEEENRLLEMLIGNGERVRLNWQPLSGTKELDRTGSFSRPETPPEDPMQALRDGEVDLVVSIDRAKMILNDPVRKAETWARLHYMEDSPQGREAKELLRELISLANDQQLYNRFVRERAAQRGPPGLLVSAWGHKVERTGGGSSFGLLTSLIPLVLILMTITGAVYPAIDLTAGERERGTLEILVAAPIPRMGLLFAKYISVFVVAVLTALVNLVSMTVSLQLSGLGKAMLGEGTLSFLAILQVFFLMLLFAAFFSAVLLAVTSFAKSFKEAQVYLIPLMLLSLTPGMASLIPGIGLEGFLQVVPLLNIVLLGRNLLEGSATLSAGLIVVVSTAVYAVAAISLAARIFGAEAVLYSEQAGWSDLFRRPSKATPVPKASTALLAMGLLFPCIFVVTNLLGGGEETSPALSLLFVPCLSALIFLLLPALICLWGRHGWGSAFHLLSPAWRFWLPALLLGLSLWCFGAELGYWMRELGLRGLPDELLKRQRERYAELRAYSPFLVVFALGIIPAIVEELFFRGFLFRALEKVMTPRGTILATAFLFAVLHMVMGSVLAVERFPSSFLMGLILGYLTWKAGSVWPAMLLHVCFNASLQIVAYHEPRLVMEGWLEAEQSHLPLSWLGVAGVVLILGLVTLLLIPARKKDSLSELASSEKAN